MQCGRDGARTEDFVNSRADDGCTGLMDSGRDSRHFSYPYPAMIYFRLLVLSLIVSVLWFVSSRLSEVGSVAEKELESAPCIPRSTAVALSKPAPSARQPEVVKTDTSRPDAHLTLPDGSTVPVLNGAYGAPRMDWPPRFPWSPIVGRQVDPKGCEWFVHEDGSRSTTRMVYHSQVGRQTAVTSVYNPTQR